MGMPHGAAGAATAGVETSLDAAGKSACATTKAQICTRSGEETFLLLLACSPFGPCCIIHLFSDPFVSTPGHAASHCTYFPKEK